MGFYEPGSPSRWSLSFFSVFLAPCAYRLFVNLPCKKTTTKSMEREANVKCARLLFAEADDHAVCMIW